MDVSQYTGSAEELPDILDCWDAQERLAAWRDAAVSRHLAEAGAVHPAVHTPARVGQWLEAHGWERKNVSDLVVSWRRDKDHGGGGWVYQPVNPETVDYAQRVVEVVSKAAWANGVPNAPVLLEIAAMPEEWAW